MKATVVIDNIGGETPDGESLSGEWGLCIYIEYNGKNILLDTGSSELFAYNCRALGLSLADIDYGVLSHAHYDHANGLETFFNNNDNADFYVRKGCRDNCFNKKWMFKRYIGTPKGVLEKYSDRIVYADDDYYIDEGIALIPHKTDGLSKIGSRECMYRKEGLRWVPDDFSHEQSLVIDTDKGLVIFNSCSHGGADTIINEVKDTYPDKEMYAIVGGFHLIKRPDSEIRTMASHIKETGIKYVYTGHCTGRHAYKILKGELGDALKQFHVGMEIDIT